MRWTSDSAGRRRCLIGLALLLPGSRGTPAQPAWPAKSITLIVPVAAGGILDVVPRVLLPLVSRELGRSVVVENKPGADLTIGTSAAARSAPDGHTWLASGIALTTHPLLRQVPYDPIADFEPVSLIGTTSVVAVVPRSLGVRTLAEFVALARSQPDVLNHGNSAIGSLAHLSTALFHQAAGIRTTEVLYQGQAPALADLIANRVNFMMVSPATVQRHISAGVLHALAMAGKNRSALFPDVPTFAELGYPSVNLDSWIGILVPAGTPVPVIARINAAFNKALADPQGIARLTDMGVAAAAPNAPAELRRRMREETALWPKVFESAGIKREK